jgi:S-phase genomic integrity recombination mediator, C-terminal/S-phase genomic integrity recombination mediator, N-terminal
MSNFLAVHSSFSKDGNSSKSSSYHLLHGQLEWRWIYLTTIYKQEYSKGLLGSDESDFRTELSLLVYDLMTLSVAKIQKCTNASIIFTSPFICSCVKEIWIVIYQLIEELQDGSLTFWNIISGILNIMKSGKNPHDNFPEKKILLRSSSHIKCKNVDQFSIWFISGLVKLLSNKLTDNRESYELFESVIKSYLSVEQSEENLRVLLVIVSEVLFDVWTLKSEILMPLWEIFQRKINSPFFIAGQSPNFMAVTCVSGVGYLEKIKSQQITTTKLNPNLTSYDMFVYLLGKMVQRFTDEGQKIQVQKIFGRIYTKFPASKLQTLNEMGIHNILKLFIALSISTNFVEIAKKVSDTLLQIPIEKINQQQQLMKGHMAMLILYRENQMNITQYVTKLMSQVNIVMERTSSSVTSVLKILADALPVIVLQNSEDADTFENGEDILIDTWIVKYLNGGTVAEQDRVFESLTKIIQKLREAQSKPLGSANLVAIVKKLFKTILPHCKQVFGKSESIWLPAMVANLCLLSSDFQHQNSSEIPKFDVIFKTFLELNCSNIENSIKFLTVVLDDREKIRQLDKLTIMQHWIKCSILLSGSNSNLKELTRCVMKIDDFTSLSITAKNQPEEFLNSKEPLATFITDVGKKYSSTPTIQVKFQLIEKIHGYYAMFEKWALPILQLQQQQTSNQRTQNIVSTDESVMRIYMFISITIMHCSELIYVRSKPSCFFNVAISHFLLPSSLMMGQNQSRSIVVSIYKVWALLIEGISKLDYKNDNHIAKVLNDIIVKWAPLLKISTNSKVVSKPFVNVTNLQNADVVELVYGKLGKNFVALQNRKPSPHACMILTMVEEVMHVVEGEEKKVMLVWKNLMSHVMEAAMMSDDNIPSQITCFNLLNRFMKNKNFDKSLAMKQLLMTSLQAVTQSQLSYYSAFCFRWF